MRLRKKWWAEEALVNTNFFIFDGRPFKNNWRQFFEVEKNASLCRLPEKDLLDKIQKALQQQNYSHKNLMISANKEMSIIKIDETTKRSITNTANSLSAVQEPNINRQAEIHLELGCGKGHFACEMAKKHPDIKYIAVDIEMNALVYALPELNKKHKNNLRFLVYDIESIQDCFGPNEIDKIYIHFCNPWPKAAHHKRRLTHPRQLIQYQQFLKKSGLLQIKTDDNELYSASLEYLHSCGFTVIVQNDNLAPEDDPDMVFSDYEAKWRSQGISIKYILARLDSPEQRPENLKIAKNMSQEIFLQKQSMKQNEKSIDNQIKIERKNKLQKNRL